MTQKMVVIETETGKQQAVTIPATITNVLAADFVIPANTSTVVVGTLTVDTTLTLDGNLGVI